MSFWADMYFMNASSPVMEQMIMFHDHSMTIILMIISFLSISIINISNIKILNMNLLEDQKIETIWTMMPMFILIFIAGPSLRLLYLMEETFSPDLTVKILGSQWFWSYEYPEIEADFEAFLEMDFEDLENFRLIEADNFLTLPLETLTRFLITSSDVIHSWTIQSLGLKTDAIPGRLNQISFLPLQPGVYFGQCSEICGTNHSFMPITLQITDMDTF